MKRILLMVIKLLGHVPAWFWRICSFAKDTEEQRYSIEEKYNYIREIAIKANKVGRVTIVSSGEENLPEEDMFTDFLRHAAGKGTCRISVEEVFAATRGVLLAQSAADSGETIPFDR